MNYHDQSKDELVKALQQLQQKYNSLNDIYEESLNQNTVSKNEEKLRTIIQTAIDGFGITDIDGRFIEVNQAYCNMLGYSEQELLALNITDLEKIESKQEIREHFQKIRTVGHDSFETQHIRKDGNVIDIRIKVRYKPEESLFIAFISDITKIKQTERELIKSKEQYESFVQHSGEGIYLYEFVKPFYINASEDEQIHALYYNSYIADCNEKLANMYGVASPDEIIGKSLIDFHGSDNDPDNIAFLKAFIQSDYRIMNAVSKEFDLDGNELYISNNVIGIVENGVLLRVWASQLDVTLEKQAENKLNLSFQREQKLGDIVRNSPMAIAYGYPDGRLDNCNKAFEKLTGYTEKELKKIKWNDELTPSHWNEVEVKELLNLNPNNNSIQYEKEYIHKNGTIIPIELFVYGKFDKNNNLLHYIGFIIDITERKKAEENLRQYKHVVSSSTDMISLLDTQFNYLAVNNAYAKAFNLTPEQFIGKNVIDFFGEAYFKKNISPVAQRCLEEKKEIKYELWFNLPAYKKRFLSVAYNPYYNNNNEIVGFVVNGRNITDQKTYQEALVVAKEKAEESDKLKSAFLANMSHEIRTPLNGILGFSELLKEPELSGENQQNYISVIERGGKRLLNTINDIIDISKIEAGQTELLISETDIKKQLAYITTFFKPEVEKKNIQLIVKNNLSIEDNIIKTDKDKVDAILINLVKNAIKYTDSGTIELGCKKKANTLEFYVKDTGVGIPKDRQKAIFDRFVQADIKDTRALQGSGLGLSISKSYVEMLGGKIWLSSKENKGSTFFFSIAITPVNIENTDLKTAENSLQSNAIKPLKILIAEDDKASEMLIAIAVKGIKNEIITVTNGVDAVETCRNNPDIDLVLMDIKLPKMTGYEATKQIRKFNNAIVIIAQTAYGLAGDREKSIEAGCNDYISKPIDKDELITKIRTHF